MNLKTYHILQNRTSLLSNLGRSHKLPFRPIPSEVVPYKDMLLWNAVYVSKLI